MRTILPKQLQPLFLKRGGLTTTGYRSLNWGGVALLWDEEKHAAEDAGGVGRVPIVRDFSNSGPCLAAG